VTYTGKNPSKKAETTRPLPGLRTFFAAFEIFFCIAEILFIFAARSAKEQTPR
jgi:hypothetical protein